MRTALTIVATLCGVVQVTSFAVARTESVLDSQVITSSTGGERMGADIAVVDVTGIPSMDRLRSPNNVVLFIWVGPFNVVNGFGFDVVLQTLVPGSRLSDVAVAITNSSYLAGPAFGIRPAPADTFPGGPTNYMAPLHDLSPVFDVVPALADGLIRVEFFDAPNEAEGLADAMWISGSISLQTRDAIPDVVPPSTAGLIFVVGIGALRRNRRSYCRHRT